MTHGWSVTSDKNDASNSVEKAGTQRLVFVREPDRARTRRIDVWSGGTGRAVSKRQKVDGKHHSDVPPKCTEEPRVRLYDSY